MNKQKQQQRRREILKSDEHWSVLSERLGVSRATIYRTRQERDETQDYAERPRVRASDTQFSQISVSGITRHGGAVTEEFQRELQEDGGARIYTEMSVHPVVAAVLFAIKMGGLRRVRWWTEPASDKPDDKRVAEFVDECREDMSQSWSEVTSQIFNMLKFGYQPCELVYKKRLGQEPPKYVEDPARSRYADGLIGWRRWQFINPLSLASGNAWDFDDYGRVQAINQIPPPDYKPRKIPMEKALLFRTEVEYDNPEGRSILRPMYKPYYFATNLAEVEAIGAERLGVGLPVMYLGNDCSLSGADSDYDLAKGLVTGIRCDEQMGVVIPRPRLGTSGEGQGMLLELMSPPSRGLVDFDAVIDRYEKRMAMTVLAQFIFIGMRDVGTQALASTSKDFFVDAVGAWADAVGDVINRFALPRMLALNPFGLEEMPVLKHSEIGVLDLTGIAQYVNALVGAQVLSPYPELQKHLLEIADFPEMPEKPARLTPPSPQLQPATGPIAPEGPEQPVGVEGEEDAERFALRLKQGGPKWERATNAYQQELQRTWADWADRTAGDLAGAETEEERDDITDEAVAAIVIALMLLGRKHLPQALTLGLGGDPSSPEGIRILADAMLENERYLNDSLAPAIRTKLEQGIAGDPAIATDAASLGGLLGTFNARVGNYAGAFWALIARGVIDKVSQREDANEVPTRIVLDPNAKHCEECPQYAKEYDNFQAMLAETGGRVPGQFKCNGNCRCTLLFKLPGGGWGRW